MLNGPSGIRQISLPSVVNATSPNDWKNAKTRSPSVTGDGDAGPLTFSSRSFAPRGSVRRHTSLPVARSSASTTSDVVSAPVTKMRVSVSTGDEWPTGSGAFHTTFFSGPNSDGSADVFEMPVPFGPRNLDQSVSDDSSKPADSSAASSNIKSPGFPPEGGSYVVEPRPSDLGLRPSDVGLLLVTDRPQELRRPEIHRPVRNRRRAERIVAELVLR